MKKSLVALAILGTFAGVASAQSSVTLYGIADVWAGRQKIDAAPGTSSTSVLQSGGMSTSRLGFKGSEDLGGGLNAIFGLEAGIAIDTGTSTSGGGLQFNRQSYVGFNGGFGEIVAGKLWTAYDDIEAAGNQYADASSFAVEYAVMDTGRNYQANPNNGFKYTSPDFGGFSGAVSYSLDEDTTVKTNVTSFHVKYAGGPLFVGFGYQDEGSDVDLKYTRLNGSYDFGVVKLLGTFGRVKEAVGSAKEYSIGVHVPVGAVTLTAAYAVHNPNADYSVNPDGKRKGFGVGALYPLSKRTTVYAAYTTANTDDAAGARIAETRLLGVGVRHAF